MGLELLTIRENVRETRRDGDADVDMVGTSRSLLVLQEQVKRIAPLRCRVLINGESGTGKDLVARSLHFHSARRAQPFIKVNCAAIPSDLVESELFGHVRGAFTGATSSRRGLFECAHGGTLFLDEVGELPLLTQAKLLRALQNGEVTPVGSNRQIHVDVRIIAATNRNLQEAVATGRFREDLYYRLAVVCLEVPSLKERIGDVPLLVRHFGEQVASENNLAVPTFSPRVWEPLLAYHWPGNIRELRNVVERLVILGGTIIDIADLPQEVRTGSPKPMRIVSEEPPVFQPLTWEEFKRRSERDYLVSVLRHCRGNVSEAARVLGVERSTVHKWLKSNRITKQLYMPACPSVLS